MSRSEPLSQPAGRALPAMTRQICVGLLVVLLILPVAAAGSARVTGGLALFGEIAVFPAFMFLAGLLISGESPGRGGSVRLPLFAAVAALAGAAAALATRHGWRAGLEQATPVLRLLLLPLIYSLLLRPLRRAPAVYVMFLALLCHVVGVVFGGKAGFVLTLLPYFTAGALVGRRRGWFAALIESEPEYSAACGPILMALALVVCVGAAHAATLAAVGPASLLVGLAAGPTALASARALSATPFAQPLARLGRAAPALAIAWLPLFHFLVAVMNRGVAPALASLVLLSTASLLIATVAAEAFADDESAAADGQAEPATSTR
jgi:hypothetical protein